MGRFEWTTLYVYPEISSPILINFVKYTCCELVLLSLENLPSGILSYMYKHSRVFFPQNRKERNKNRLELPRLYTDYRRYHKSFPIVTFSKWVLLN